MYWCVLLKRQVKHVLYLCINTSRCIMERLCGYSAMHSTDKCISIKAHAQNRE